MDTLREQLFNEIQQIPDHHLEKILDVIHFFRLGLDKAETDKSIDIRQFAGSWSDMDDAAFSAWDEEWQERRHQAFRERQSR